MKQTPHPSRRGETGEGLFGYLSSSLTNLQPSQLGIQPLY